MAITKITFSGLTIALFVAFLVSFPLASAQAPSMSPGGTPTAAAPSGDCMTSLLNMSDCLTYVETGSKLKTPDKACCPELAGLVDSNPICLCQLFGDTSSYGFTLDKNKALGLPKVCKIITPSPSLCAEIGIPIGAPVASEAPGASPPAERIIEAPAVSPSTAKNGASSIMTGFDLLFLTGLSSLALQFFF
ncbi:non-specific lipid transfer protein GPI-anchored 2-like [Macadamia integrifolia]|uniref:non-specific lipid transfer protein GPI-anchored 2-like n=1 Tax=Macadamia integrifolia TaxID=60698 RepID=UPI001C4EB45F|nr:non-specific lipid transfer protein GPI-anchored 2-like [Macadamia integrifolia]